MKTKASPQQTQQPKGRTRKNKIHNNNKNKNMNEQRTVPSCRRTSHLPPVNQSRSKDSSHPAEPPDPRFPESSPSRPGAEPTGPNSSMAKGGAKGGARAVRGRRGVRSHRSRPQITSNGDWFFELRRSPGITSLVHFLFCLFLFKDFFFFFLNISSI